MILLPPVLQGPLFPESKCVYCEPIIDGATLIIYANDAIIFQGPRPVDGWIKFDYQLSYTQLVLASIVLGNDKSRASIDAIKVVNQSDSLPPPEFVSVINSLTKLVAINQLVIGAKLRIWEPSDNTLLAEIIVERSFQYVRLDLKKHIGKDAYLIAQQSWNGKDSEKRQSATINYIGDVQKIIPAPDVKSIPLSACRSDIGLSGLPGLEVSVVNEGWVTDYLVAGLPEFTVNDCHSLQQGKLKVLQKEVLSSTVITSSSPEYQVGPPVAPRKPQIITPYCQTIQFIKVINLDPGANISVFSWSDAKQSWILVGTTKVGAEEQDIPIPKDQLRSQGVSIRDSSKIAVRQDRCGVQGELSDPVGVGPMNNQRVPKLAEPIADCSQFAILENCTAGTAITLAAHPTPTGAADQLLKKTYIATEGRNVIPFYRPVQEGEFISGGCIFCDEFVAIPNVQVTFPGQIKTQLEPVKPGDLQLHFKDCVIGSRIDVFKFLNGQGTFVNFGYPAAKEWSLAIGEAVPEINPRMRSTYQFKVTVCNKVVSEGSQTVKLGTLKVAVDPATVFAGDDVTVVIHTTDQVDGTKVNGNIVPDNNEPFAAGVHQTNSILKFKVPLGRTAPYKGTIQASNYENAAYVIGVTKKPSHGTAFITQVGADDPAQDVVRYELNVKGTNLDIGAPVSVAYSYAVLETLDGINYAPSPIPHTEPAIVSTVDSYGVLNYKGQFNLQVSYNDGSNNDPYDPQPPLKRTLNLGITAIIVYKDVSHSVVLTSGVAVTWLNT